jgi:NAD(P)H-nitrite reductase large subunit
VAERLYRIAYPAVGYGPPPLNRLVLHPDLFATLPSSVRRRLNRRLLRPGGSPWLRTLVDGKVAVTEGTGVREIRRRDGVLELSLDDGTSREADDVILATGYRFSLDRLGFVSDEIRARIRVDDGWPVLDRYFRSTERDILFVGYAAEGRFGPISRFVLGTAFTAARVAECLTA